MPFNNIFTIEQKKTTITIVEETLPINTENISMEEFVKCVNGFKNGKAAGLDNITN